jgi:hypothetical protein
VKQRRGGASTSGRWLRRLREDELPTVDCGGAYQRGQKGSGGADKMHGKSNL